MTRRTLAILALFPLLPSAASAQTGQIPCQPPTAPGVVCLQGQITGTLLAGVI